MIYANWEERSARSNVKKDTDTAQYYCDSYCDSTVHPRARCIILRGMFKPLIRKLAIFGLHCDIVNPRRLELETAKEMFGRVVWHTDQGSGWADSAMHCGFQADGGGI